MQAMQEEMDSIQRNDTWKLTELPHDKKKIGTKWVYKTKFNSDGSVERHKARLVAKGFTQKYGIDYEETFAPIARQETIRMLISLAAHKKWSIHLSSYKQHLKPLRKFQKIEKKFLCLILIKLRT